MIKGLLWTILVLFFDAAYAYSYVSLDPAKSFMKNFFNLFISELTAHLNIWIAMTFVTYVEYVQLFTFFYVEFYSLKYKEMNINEV